MKYVIICPVRNEAEHLPGTLDSLMRQTICPHRFVIVNDGSTDDTGRIADEAAKQHDWIRVVHRADRGFRKAGGGVIDAFYSGYELVEGEAWNYIVKLDGDVSFGADYFEKCFAHFEVEPKLGIAGGVICSQRNGVVKVESRIDPRFHVRGATKIYRADCWRAIGGLIHAPGWDTLDEVKANMLGWVTRTLEGVEAIHHRPTGAAYGQWSDITKNGLANYVSGYHPLFMIAKCIRRLVEQPYLMGSMALWFGFMQGYVKRIPQVDDKTLIRYFRQQQMNRLLGRKSLWD